MKKLKIILLFAVCLVFVSTAQASIIINTGNPGGAPYYSLSKDNWLAGQFTVDQSFTITSILGYFHNVSPDFINSVSIALYQGGENIPGSLFQRQDFLVGGPQDVGGYAWRGLENLSWDVGPGRYWIGFEVDDPYSAIINSQQLLDQGLNASAIFTVLIDQGAAIQVPGNADQIELIDGFDWRTMDWSSSGLSSAEIDLVRDTFFPGSFQGQMASGFSNPLDNYARYSSNDGFYSDHDEGTIGLRVFGNAAVPEPATMFLFGAGLLGLAGVNRRKQ